MMKKLILFVVGLVFGFAGLVRGATTGSTAAADALGWQLTIHARTFQKFPLFEAMDKTAALGVKYFSLSAGVKLDGANVQLVNLSDEQIQSIKKYAGSKGLTLVNAYVAFPADEAQCRKAFEFARKAGIDMLVGEPGPEALDTVDKLCREYNIRVAIHDHPKPSQYWNPQFVLDAIKGRSPLIGACADTGHWVRSGLDPVECLKKLRGHVFVLHFKDLNEKNRKAHDVPWGTGVGQCKAMMEELKSQGFHGAFCVEYEYHWDNSTPEVAQCVKFFNDTCGELVGSPASAPAQ
jgi:sugar phosphate isomerase/epimerase